MMGPMMKSWRLDAVPRRQDMRLSAMPPLHEGRRAKKTARLRGFSNELWAIPAVYQLDLVTPGRSPL